MTTPPPVNPNDISWSNNAGKRSSDSTVYRAMAYDLIQQARKSKPLRALTFPAKTWVWEQGLMENYPDAQFEFVGLERDPDVHADTVEVANGFRNFHMPAQPMDFLSFAKRSSGEPQFDIIYLDWMGTWSKEKKADIEALFASDMLAIGGLLLITVSLQRGWPETLEELEDKSYNLPLAFYDERGEDKYTSHLKVRGIPHWIQDCAKDNHLVSMRPLLASVYYSCTGSAQQTQTRPQLQILMLRES